jgi:tetratricopeptide (TPR) repeat protein
MDDQALAEFLSLPVNPKERWEGGGARFCDLFGVPPEEVPASPRGGQLGMALWHSVASDLVHAEPMEMDTAESMDELVDTMLHLSQKRNFRYRPARVDCNDRELAEALHRQLEGSGTAVHYRAEMSEWAAILRNMAENVAARMSLTMPSLREAGCSDRQIRAFAVAAAEFYRARLWDVLDDIDLITIESPKPPRQLRHAIVLGAGKKNYGLGFFQDAEDHHAMSSGEADPRDLSLFSCVYEPVSEVRSGDVELWEELDLPLETGEAFPEPSLSTPDGLRRPTPKELEFLTVVLTGLARTAEEEIDAGRWTKEVEVSGKRKTCVFCVPNLLDPPDTAEWIRRGKMPDRRIHELHMRLVQEFVDAQCEGMDVDQLNEAINAQFVGRRLDAAEMPRNTPSERAEALCQEAVECFGRRRVVLARAALAEDPDHVEAHILIAESTRAVDRRIELFQHAKSLAAARLGDDLEKLAGEFWGYHPTRPYMRACHGLAAALALAGQTSDAVEQYRAMLQLNPNDNQGVRYELVPLLLRHERDAQAMEVLDQYDEETTLWMYSKALVEFRRVGRNAKSKQMLREAFKANPHVMTLLQSGDPLRLSDSYVLGSPEEAALCIEELESLWDETQGCLEWMFCEFASWERDRAKRARDKMRKSRHKTKNKRTRRR